MLHKEFDFTLEDLVNPENSEHPLPYIIPLLLHTLKVGHMIAQNTLRLFLGTESTNISQITQKMSCIKIRKHLYPVLPNDIGVAIEITNMPTQSLCIPSNCKHAERCPLPAILHDRRKLDKIPQVIREKLNV